MVYERAKEDVRDALFIEAEADGYGHAIGNPNRFPEHQLLPIPLQESKRRVSEPYHVCQRLHRGAFEEAVRSSVGSTGRSTDSAGQMSQVSVRRWSELS